MPFLGAVRRPGGFIDFLYGTIITMTPTTPPFPSSSPTVGRTVLVKGHRSNGSDVHPGVVTRVWSPTCVNLTLFPDYAAPLPCGSAVEFRQTETEADDLLAGGYTGLVAFWPTRS